MTVYHLLGFYYFLFKLYIYFWPLQNQAATSSIFEHTTQEKKIAALRDQTTLQMPVCAPVARLENHDVLFAFEIQNLFRSCILPLQYFARSWNTTLRRLLCYYCYFSNPPLIHFGGRRSMSQNRLHVLFDFSLLVLQRSIGSKTIS